MSHVRRLLALFRELFLPEQRPLFTVSLLLLGLYATLLYLPGLGNLDWLQLSAKEQTPSMLQVWDNLAWVGWLLMVPLILRLIRHHPLTGGHRHRNLRRLLVGSGMIYLLTVNLRFSVYFLLGHYRAAVPQPHWGWDSYSYNMLGRAPWDLLTFGGFCTVAYALDYAFNLRVNQATELKRELDQQKLASELARLELSALRAQLHPHFLFNCFNAVASLVRLKKNDTAVEVIAQLSALLRLALERTVRQTVSLEQELDFTRRYLNLEQVRFGEKLHFEISAGPAELQAVVPNILLQPLVENAIKHAISHRISPGWIRVTAVRTGERLRIEMMDDGPEGLPRVVGPSRVKSAGIGLANVRAQLDLHYGTDYRLDLFSRPAGGTTVTLDMPWHSSPQTP